MQRRSWMAVLVIACAAGGPPALALALDGPVTNTVRLDLQIAGVGREGCTVTIKPAHPGCTFPEVVKRIDQADPAGVVRLDPIAIAATSTGADRDCAFAITIREPNRPDKTYKRAIRLAAVQPGKPAPVQSLACYLSSPSRPATAAKEKPARR